MNNINKTFRAGLTLAAGLVAMYSCTDTWDEHYGDFAANENSYPGTLMQALEDKAPDFAKVVKAYGYDRELASDNFYSVWAQRTVHSICLTMLMPMVTVWLIRQRS